MGLEQVDNVRNLGCVFGRGDSRYRQSGCARSGHADVHHLVGLTCYIYLARLAYAGAKYENISILDSAVLTHSFLWFEKFWMKRSLGLENCSDY